jgi:uncharacterized membrane protein YgcG
MVRMFKNHFTLSLLALMAITAVAACKKLPDEAYFNRGAPESLLDYSSEVVNLPVSNKVQVNEFSSWVNSDQPTRAEIYCTASSKTCDDALDVLDLYGVPYTHVPSDQATVTLVYERVSARDCEQRFIDNRNNFYNLNHPTFGCSIAANIVQHVSDKKQLLNPSIADLQDGEKGVQTYKRYLEQSPQNSGGNNSSGGSQFGNNNGTSGGSGGSGGSSFGGGR